MFQHIVESLPRTVEVDIAEKGGQTAYYGFWNEMFDEEVYTYFWSSSLTPYSLYNVLLLTRVLSALVKGNELCRLGERLIFGMQIKSPCI
jgi:hypothetical protein